MGITHKIDLNADLGEDETPSGIARDVAMMGYISSCNIASGGHAGNAETMAAMLRAAKRHNVHAGAHPSYPDRQGFGRQPMAIAADRLRTSLSDQISALLDIAGQKNVTVHHIKPHGALYNDAQDDEELSGMLTNLAETFGLSLVGMDQSVLQKMAQKSGVGFLCESFIDRRYDDKARLVPRAQPGAVITHKDQQLEQALALAQGNPLPLNAGNSLSIRADTLCLHSDSDGALASARYIHDHLVKAGFAIRAAAKK